MKVFDLLALARQRHELARLSNDALRDIGLTRAEAQKEAQKPVWDVPEHWLRCKHDKCTHVQAQTT